MTEEIKEDNNCIVKAFENNPIAILHEDINSKKIYYFKASDIGKALNIVNIRSTIQNYDDDERVVRNVYDPQGTPQDTIFLSSQGVYRLLYSSKKEVAKKFRKWAGNILDDIIFNESAELKRQLEEREKELEEKNRKIELLEHKPHTHGFLSRKKGFVYLINDLSKPGHYKIGMTYNADKRLRSLNTSSSEKSLRIYFEIETYDYESAERSIQFILQPFNIKGRREWFYFSNDFQVKYAIHIMTQVKLFHDKFNFESYDELLEKYKNDPNIQNINLNIFNFNDITPGILPFNANFVKGINETNVFKLTGQQLSNKTGNYKGVFWSTEKQKWRVELKHNYKNIFLGYYSTELDGAKAYNDYAFYLNNEMNTNYSLNEIEGYTTTPRNIPKENEKLIADKKTSIFRGVSFDSKRQYYVVGIKYKGKSYALGNDKSELECAKLYNQQAAYFNKILNTEYELNDYGQDIKDIIPKNIYQEIQNNKTTRKSSKYYGVSFMKSQNKYKAVLVHNKKQIHIGFFSDEIEAAKAYNKKAVELNENHNGKYKINEIV
jgi:prophage antirepressor-like protein